MNEDEKKYSIIDLNNLDQHLVGEKFGTTESAKFDTGTTICYFSRTIMAKIRTVKIYFFILKKYKFSNNFDFKMIFGYQKTKIKSQN